MATPSVSLIPMRDMRLRLCQYTRHVMYLTDGSTRKATIPKRSLPLVSGFGNIENYYI
jgi:hypothetical protein